MPPAPTNGGECPHPLNVLSSFEEQDKLSSERIGVSKRWSLHLLWWLHIYSGGQTEHNDIWTLKLNLTLKVKVNHSPVKMCFSLANFLSFHLFSGCPIEIIPQSSRLATLNMDILVVAVLATTRLAMGPSNCYVAYLTKEIKPNLDKTPLNFKGILAELRLTLKQPGFNLTQRANLTKGYSVRKLMGVCRWPLKLGPKKIEGKMKFGA